MGNLLSAARRGWAQYKSDDTNVFQWRPNDPHSRHDVLYDIRCILVGHAYKADACVRCNWHRTHGF